MRSHVCLIAVTFWLMTRSTLFGAEAVSPNHAWDMTVVVDGQAVELRVRAPLHASGPCPVIIFSHGLGGSREGYWPLAEAWASAGFVVIQPTHVGSDTQTLRAAGFFGFTAAARQAAADPAILAGRPRLIGRLIDLLPAIQNQLTDFHGTLDATRIGVGGHSYGAWTALAVAGVDYGIPGVCDKRPLAFLALSPPGPGRVPPDTSAAGRPTLVMIGSQDYQPAFLNADDGIERNPAWREQLWQLLPTGKAFLAVLSNAHHSAFSAGQGARLAGEPVPEPWMGEALTAITLTWWRAQLCHEDSTMADLRSGQVVPVVDRQRVRWQQR